MTELYPPISAFIIWALADQHDAAFVPQSIVFGVHVDGPTVFIDLLVDSALICKTTLDQFAAQVAAITDFIVSSPCSSCTTTNVPFSSQLLSCAPRIVKLEDEHIVLEWLFQHAEHRPDAIAHEIYSSMDSPAQMLTYGELNKQSNVLAHWMLTNGMQIENKVCLCSTRSVRFYVAMAAILKAGGCYVSASFTFQCIDPELPAERKRYIAQDSSSRWVFITNAQDTEIFGDRALMLSDDFIREVQSEHGAQNVSRATLSSLAYLLYTSGTTGNPKGCLLEHRGLYWAMQSFCNLPKPVTDPNTDKRLALASTAFDVHISEIVQSWCLGSRLVSAPRFELLTQLRKYIIDIGVTHIGMVPSMIEALLGTPEGLPIKYLVSGGEKITDSLLQKWSALPNVILANFYGPTEVTIGCTSRRVGSNDRKENIGRPFPSCSAYVVDPELNVVPMGCPGELIISGPLVARGYHNLPEATAKAFIEFPEPGCRAYRTGDLVRMMPDHSIEIMGRIDLQVKYRGVRIETEGISSILRAAVKPILDSLEASTFITSHPQISQELLVSFVATANSKISVMDRRSAVPRVVSKPEVPEQEEMMKNMKKAVEAQLPAYQRPAYIIPVEFIPLSLNGKTDNKMLAHVLSKMDMGELLALQR
ncbi:hypothetical protein BDP27DRAFT_1209530 [Rhodocollybia butyracea]|uniref:AMP-dependent synthetase/ligase domain-containing protein n=1 Tax=Rhodocollybia butyracea TaxID=206335 RepID=A0A9P5Q7T7_9AGAR|nr:hypothetical protein BDP27DRAFT_1209530 [Rhodocollybia butyracea]